jgi:hypothetical protein
MRTRLIKPNNDHTLEKDYPSTIEEISDKVMKPIDGHHLKAAGSQFISNEQDKNEIDKSNYNYE